VTEPAIHIEVRPATIADAGLIHRFVHDLAAYEKLSNECIASESGIRETLFGAEPVAKALLAFLNEEPAGFALYFFTYSTFLAKPGLYLEDIFVIPELRGRGVGKRLFHELLCVAQEQGCGRCEWSVLDWNEDAIRFYEGLGAKAQASWVKYRLDEKEISTLANSRVLA
jgi:GNAT superfamily N-acetyltransferase